MQREWRIHRAPQLGVWSAPLLGVLFGLGWSPCIGPTIGAVQSLALTEASAARGALLSFAYCLGLGLPFVLVGLMFRRAMGAIGWVKRHYTVVMRIGGGLLVLIGVLLVTGVWQQHHDRADVLGRERDDGAVMASDLTRAASPEQGLSTAPIEDASGPRGLGVVGWLRWVWRQLTTHAHRADPAVPARAGRDPRIAVPAARLRTCRRSTSTWRDHPTLGPGARPARAVRRVRLAVVRRDLRAAVRLPGRLRACPRSWQHVRRAAPAAAGGAAAPRPAARAPHSGVGRGTAGRPRRGAGPAALAALAGRTVVRPRPAAARSPPRRATCARPGNLVFHLALLVLLVGGGARIARSGSHGR